MSQAHNAKHDRAIVFVHGFGSGPEKCWGTLRKLLEADDTIQDVYETIYFKYRSPMFRFKFWKTVPTLKEVAERLGTELDEHFEKYKQVTLVGHSQGGLLIQHYLWQVLKAKRGKQLRHLRQVVLMATPNLGSDVFGPVRKLITHIPGMNPQERSLRVLNPEISKVRRGVLRRIVAASRRGPAYQPVPMTAFFGISDWVVRPASAKGHFFSTRGLPGGHTSILEPDDHDDLRYRALHDIIQRPVGHVHVFEIDEYTIDISIAPFDGNKDIPMPTSGRPDRTVKADNVAVIRRTIAFSDRNQCEDIFELRYATRGSGGITVRNHDALRHVGPRKYISAYEDQRKEIRYQFRPEAGKRETFGLEVTVYGGFSEGNRDVHFHFENNAYIKRLRCRLDLRGFAKEGHDVVEPDFFFSPFPPEDHESCADLELSEKFERDVPEENDTWTWDVHDVTTGVVDIRWDKRTPYWVVEREAGAAPVEPPNPFERDPFSS